MCRGIRMFVKSIPICRSITSYLLFAHYEDTTNTSRYRQHHDHCAWYLFSSLDVPDALFLLFQLISLIASIAISFCRLFRVQFKDYKTERVIAIVYLCLAFLSIYPLLLFTAFTAWNFRVDDTKWYILAVSTSVYYLDFCILWLSVQSAKLLVRTRRQTNVESIH